MREADDLIEKGMSGDRDEIASRLAVVGAHRLAEYWMPFVGTDGRFVAGTSFDVRLVALCVRQKVATPYFRCG